jgi:DNA-binding transcriptional ArsR family regulator
MRLHRGEAMIGKHAKKREFKPHPKGEIVEMLRDAGLSYGEIARRVEMTPSAVRSLAMRLGISEQPGDEAPERNSHRLGSRTLVRLGPCPRCALSLFEGDEHHCEPLRMSDFMSKGHHLGVVAELRGEPVKR